MRDLLTTVLELGGALAIAVGAALAFGVGGLLIALGVVAVGASWAVSR